MRSTFMLQAFGASDPTAQWSGDVLIKSFSNEAGVCSVNVFARDQAIHFSAAGADAEQTVSRFAAWAQADDGYATFVARDPQVEKLRRVVRGLRLVRVPWLFDVACSAVLQQRVRYADATRGWRSIAMRFGRPAPNGQLAFPTPAQFSEIPLHDLIGFGIDPQRSRTLLMLAKECRFRPLRPELSFERLRLLLSRIPGIGPWTTETVLGFGAGDPDAVPLGDLYLPHLVTYAFTGRERGSDELMLELLEPYRPLRFHVIRMLYSSHLKVPGWGDKSPAH